MLDVARKVVGKLRADGPWETMRYGAHWLCEKYYERQLGIHTAGSVHRDHLGFANPAWHNYDATGYRTLTRALRYVAIQPDRDVFLDFGAGRGRAVIVAATYPFRRVIGVEISPQLSAEAEENVRRARRHLKCQNVELVTADAASYAVPAHVTVVFLYNPFAGDVLAAVISNIRASWTSQPHPLTVMYKFPNWVDNQFDRCDWLVPRHTIPCYSTSNEKLVIYTGK